jgi:Sulfotransferase domain
MQRVCRVADQVIRVLTGRQMAGRGLTVFPTDLFLVSYPRSGNNWMRFLIGNLIDPDDPVTFANLESRVPEIYFNPDHRLRRLPRPRVFKSHEPFQAHYPHVIYIVRDPRDVAVSNYHHNLQAGNIPPDYSIENFIPRFVAGEFDSRWGSWADHVKSWFYLRQNQPGFLFLRYEDIKGDPAAQLARVAQFLKQCSFHRMEIRSESLQRAIDLSSSERMRALEAKQGRAWRRSHSIRGNKPYVAVRAANCGSWKTELPTHSATLIESAWEDVIKIFSYEISHLATRHDQ